MTKKRHESTTCRLNKYINESTYEKCKEKRQSILSINPTNPIRRGEQTNGGHLRRGGPAALRKLLWRQVIPINESRRGCVSAAAEAQPR